MAVILPTGSSERAMMERARESAKRQKMAPKQREKKKTVRLLLPKMSRTMWGMMSPTKPMTPQQATVDAIRMEETMSTLKVVLCTFTPEDCAVSRPNCKMLRFLVLKKRKIEHTVSIKKRMMVEVHEEEVKLPMVQ